MSKSLIITEQNVINKIYLIRNKKVMIDREGLDPGNGLVAIGRCLGAGSGTRERHLLRPLRCILARGGKQIKKSLQKFI
jgi:hypothetical protein